MDTLTAANSPKIASASRPSDVQHLEANSINTEAMQLSDFAYRLIQLPDNSSTCKPYSNTGDETRTCAWSSSPLNCRRTGGRNVLTETQPTTGMHNMTTSSPPQARRCSAVGSVVNRQSTLLKGDAAEVLTVRTIDPRETVAGLIVSHVCKRCQ